MQKAQTQKGLFASRSGKNFLFALSDSQTGDGSLQSGLSFGKFHPVLRLGQTALGSFTGSPSPDHINLDGLFGCRRKNSHMIRQYLGIPAHDSDMPRTIANPEAQFSNLELAEEWNVVRKHAELAFLSRSDHDIDHLAQELLLRRHDLK
jgi:hypothetical protein